MVVTEYKFFDTWGSNIDKKRVSFPLGERASDLDVYDVVDHSENTSTSWRGHQ